jgi:DNA-binding XRE family transcriptional regulator
MDHPLRAFRKRRGLSQQEAAAELELNSKGYISSIETGSMDCSLRLALRIEQWSGGEVRAADICAEAAKLLPAAEARA